MTIDGIHSQMEKASLLTKGELLGVYFETAGQLIETLTELDSFRRRSKEMALQYSQLKDQLAGFERESRRLSVQVKELQESLSRQSRVQEDTEEELSLRNRDQFGVSSEQGSALSHADALQPKDPIDESAKPDDAVLPAERNHAEAFFADPKPCRRKPKSSPKENWKDLPVCNDVTVTGPELAAVYGTDFEILRWESHSQVEYVPARLILHTSWTPVIAKGLDRELIRFPHSPYLLPGSYLSASLAAAVAYRKYRQHTPLYRQEQGMDTFGYALSRQTMSHQLIQLADLYLYPVYAYLCGLLAGLRHVQSDETPYEVILDGRRQGSKSFVWVHTTSELQAEKKLVVYCYELTRSTEHLRRIFGKGFEGEMMDDAFAAYFTYEKESEGKAHVSVCFAHARRKFVEAFEVLHLDGLADEQIEACPEVKAIRLIMEIYHEEKPLRDLSPEERLAGRREKVKPAVDAFFSYIDGLDPEDPSFSRYLSGAVRYAQTYEKNLRRFLEDPMIPIDNLYVERKIKSVALGRRNYLFSFSRAGAETNAMYYTMIETARANGANPYIYLLYLFTRLPALTQDPERKEIGSETMEMLMPWSPEYRRFEAERKASSPQYEPNEDTFHLPAWRKGHLIDGDPPKAACGQSI